MNTAENVQVVQRAYENFKKGNIQELIGLMAGDVHWQLPEVPNVAITGTRTGTAAVTEFFATVARDQEPLEFDPRQYIADGDKVVALGHYRWRVTGTGRTFDSDFAHIFTIKNGKVVRFQEFMDTAAVAAAY